MSGDRAIAVDDVELVSEEERGRPDRHLRSQHPERAAASRVESNDLILEARDQYGVIVDEGPRKRAAGERGAPVEVAVRSIEGVEDSLV
jgi:hypothetical protein